MLAHRIDSVSCLQSLIVLCPIPSRIIGVLILLLAKVSVEINMVCVVYFIFFMFLFVSFFFSNALLE